MVTEEKGKLQLKAEVPWSEKYRPKTLDEVAAHTDIIETSEWSAQRAPCPRSGNPITWAPRNSKVRRP